MSSTFFLILFLDCVHCQLAVIDQLLAHPLIDANKTYKDDGSTPLLFAASDLDCVAKGIQFKFLIMKVVFNLYS